jgi:LmbE family N-acetylglucosaminyl deacetylase
MIFHTIRDLPAVYRHIYLSPHLDDAALSCGGTIAAQLAAGEPPLVVTFCTAAPPACGPFSDLALEFHREWGLEPGEVVAARLREDEVAMAALGADALWAGLLDAIYRHPGAYRARETLFSAPDPADPLLPAVRSVVAELRAHLPGATFYAPLGVGSHVDHLLTRQAAQQVLGDALLFYEDFPYVAREGALEGRLAQIGVPMEPLVRPVGAGLEAKVAAVTAYASQLAELANSQLGRPAPPAEAAGLFADVVAAYAREVGGDAPAERVWRPARGATSL